ncbi:hypothetical protein PHLCEN_2v10816 [Hermanssonia centrifuga]|uniref:C2H2-type domain-containing protein n=1 Tax=Hermanssonia centrifuga TaxID=98765 RepID=A0A2R6NLT2_9APHY|nr:hypothetical protein PHLCEN_2v10816 [Hermanssonia centrifuga]
MSSARSSPQLYPEDMMYPGSEHHPSRYASPFLPQGQHELGARSSALQISTTAPSTHAHEPEEETAHPSRMQTQLQHGDVDLTMEEMNQASTSSHQSSPAPSSRAGSVLGTSFRSIDEGLSRPLTHKERESLSHLDRLKFFLATAPSRWSADGPGMSAADPSALPVGHPNSAHPALNRFLLPNSEYVSCVLWGGLYHITGTDIVRALVFRFEAFGRPVKNMKKFEEGVFSDLRNLKPGVDACLEEPKSPFLDLLFKYQCIRTQKKQKVFYWFSVPHDRLFLDALERDLKREKMGLEPTTVVAGEPALSFTYDPKRSLYDQFSKATGASDGEDELEATVRRADESAGSDGEESKDTLVSSGASDRQHQSDADLSSEADEPAKSSDDIDKSSGLPSKLKSKSALHGPNSPFFSMFSLFEGSPTYKQRRKKIPKHRSPSALGGSPYIGDSPDEYFGHPASVVSAIRAAEPQIDRYGRDTTRLSAADMFLAQARGDFGPQSNPDLIATQKERQRRAMQARADQFSGKGYFGGGMAGTVDAVQQQQAMRSSPEGMFPGHSPLMNANGGISLEHDRARPHMEQRHTFPLMNFGPQQHQRSSTQAYGAQIPNSWPPTADSVPIPKTKAFVCPLFSCGRMFKRMEHLKRHLRTHTLERPYQCQRCKKRFSRSDNLNQHIRTHMRGGDGVNGIGDEADVESEDLDELEAEDGYIGALGGVPDVNLCEVEIQGQVQEVPGDEEGLVMPTSGLQSIHANTNELLDEGQDVYYSDSGASVLVETPEQFMTTSSPNGGQWAAIRQHPSPAFSTVSMPSPHMGPTPYSHVSEYISLSAPSHKAAFDHASLYPAEMSNGPGPIRRHRSATPSMGRYNDGVRRPFTATESAARAYHPYAMAAAHSAESSPMAYTVPLGYESQLPAGVSRSGSHSRSSSSGQQQQLQLQDQMHQMLNLEQIEADGMSAAYAHEPAVVVAGQPSFSEFYRTESPLQFAAATGAFEVVETDPVHAQGMFPMSMGESHPQMSSYGSHPADSGYYSAMAHHAVSL